MSKIIKSASYHYQDSRSDKVYHFQIVDNGDGSYTVPFQYGRRGSTLATGMKTTAPVTLTNAQNIFDKLHIERLKKSYKLVGSNGNSNYGSDSEVGTPATIGSTPYTTAIASIEERQTDIVCQLLNSIDESELESLFKDDNYVAQEKHDGKRITLCGNTMEIKGINRKALICGIPETFTKSMQAILDDNKCDKAMAAFGLAKAPDFIIDGEAIGDDFYAFDIRQKTEGERIENTPYLARFAVLQNLLSKLGTPTNSKLVPLAIGEENKRFLYDSVKTRRGEGIVFKRVDAPYTSGRPNKGGTQLKFKFVQEATCQVLSVSQTKRSFAVGVNDEIGSQRAVGNVTIPANKPFPKVGDFVEVRYLYILKGGSLYQPFFKGIRDDKTTADTYDSLKFKADGSDDE